jgi:hypothetical protein
MTTSTTGPADESGSTAADTGTDTSGGAECSANLLDDFSFEAGTPNPYWMEASTNFGTPLCNPDCQGDFASDGEWFVWFGGVMAIEEASVSQEVMIPDAGEGSVTLDFQLWFAAAAGTGDDIFEVEIDGNTEFMITDFDAATYGAAYSTVTIDATAYGDGEAHTVTLRSSVTGEALSNIFVDEVNLIVCEDAVGTTTATDTGTGTGTDTDTVTGSGTDTDTDTDTSTGTGSSSSSTGGTGTGGGT